MALHAAPFTRDPYPCPDHFVLERNHPGIIAGWALGLVVFMVAVGLVSTRLQMDQRTEAPQGRSAIPAGAH